MTELVSPDEDLKRTTFKKEEWIPDWEKRTEYDYLTTASSSEEYAWEFLRRNKDYQLYCDSLSSKLKTYRPMKAEEKVNRVYVGPSHTTKTKADWQIEFPKHYSERFFKETATAKQSPLFCARSVEVLADMTDLTRPGISGRLKYRSTEWDDADADADATFSYERGLDFQIHLLKGQLAISLDFNVALGNRRLFGTHLEEAVELARKKFILYQKTLKPPLQKNSKSHSFRLIKLLRISDGLAAGHSRIQVGSTIKADYPQGFGLGVPEDIHRTTTKYVSELSMLIDKKGYLHLLA